MDLVEEYNLILKREEDKTIQVLDKVLDKSFNRIVRRLRVWLRDGNAPQTERDIAILKDLRELVSAVHPGRVDEYDRVFVDVLGSAQRAGVDVADALVGQMAGNRPRIDVSIPLEATVAAARQSHGYLRKHGERFAETSAEIVAKGIAEGRSQDRIVREMRDRLKVVKSRAEVIVRTETLRAYNDASNSYYAQNGVETVLYYATADDRSCPICAPRGGKVYKRTDIRVPVHPRCRCYLAPWDPDIAAIDPSYRRAGERHQKEMEEVNTIEPVNLSRAGVFEQFAPVPVSVD
jgi:SPP1 gp7 family putative phage head morphogenesis protein